jgi:hypothetical protein
MQEHAWICPSDDILYQKLYEEISYRGDLLS